MFLSVAEPDNMPSTSRRNVISAACAPRMPGDMLSIVKSPRLELFTLPQPLQGERVLEKIDALLRLELCNVDGVVCCVDKGAEAFDFPGIVSIEPWSSAGCVSGPPWSLRRAMLKARAEQMGWKFWSPPQRSRRHYGLCRTI